MDRGYPLNAVLDFTNGAELQIPFYGLVTNPAYGHGGKIAERLITAGLHHIVGEGASSCPSQHFLPQRPRHRRHPE